MEFHRPTKRCQKCKRDKPRSRFSKNKLKIDGLNQYCKECVKIASQKYFQRRSIRRKILRERKRRAKALEPYNPPTFWRVKFFDIEFYEYYMAKKKRIKKRPGGSKLFKERYAQGILIMPSPYNTRGIPKSEEHKKALSLSTKYRVKMCCRFCRHTHDGMTSCNFAKHHSRCNHHMRYKNCNFITKNKVKL